MVKLRTDYIFKGEMLHVLAALTPYNRLACEVALATGLRIGDVLALRTETLKQRFTVKEEKTGKNRRVYLPTSLLERCRLASGRFWVFEHRTDARKHRTRQAVYKDIKRAARLFRISANLAPHSLRKIYAVEKYVESGSLSAVQKALNHTSATVTLLYAMADELTKRKSFATLKEG